LPALIVSYTSHPGGAERILADHATAIGQDAIAACPDGWLADRLREEGVRVFRLKERPLELRGQHAAAALRLAAHGREVRDLVEALRPHTVLAWGMRAALAYAALLPRFAEPNPRFVFQHNDLLPSLTVGRAVRSAARRADLVLALSDAIATDLGLDGVEVVRAGVDLERFKPPPTDPRSGAGALFLGAITAWKRPDLAIKAATAAGVRLTIAGAPLDSAGKHLEERLRAAAGPGITFAGRVADPAEVLRHASVLLHTADREPYGMALVEALACGVPVVAPAAGGPQEIADDTCARLFRPGDADAAAAALATALADRPALGKAARARAEAHFDLRESRRRYQKVFALREEPAPSAGIAIVTVLHDSAREIRALMASIERHLPDAHLIAVDSASQDDGPQAVEQWAGASTLIRLGENAGYGRGTNAGVAAATEPVTIVLNPDVELLDDSLAKLAAEAARHPDRILAPLVMRPDGTRQDSVHPQPGSPPVIARAAAPAPIGGAAVDPWRGNKATRVGWAVGCALAARTETFRSLGPFDPRTFMYAEDLDLCLRAADQHVETWFWPYARVLHHEAHASATAFAGEPFELLAERRRSVLEERLGSGMRNRDDLIQAATFANRIAFKTLLGKPALRERSQLRALLKARRDRPAR
jgi:GT2 family glycosyltransferase/glycosyltransferase involved in cell wall biosynthesis